MKKILFEIQYWFYTKRIKQQSNNFFSYPLLIWITFGKDDIDKKWLKGRSFYSQIMSKVKVSQAALIRKQNRHPDNISQEVEDRLERFKRYRDCDKTPLLKIEKGMTDSLVDCLEQHNNNQIDQIMEKHFKDLL
jgi:hypothetical protein